MKLKIIIIILFFLNSSHIYSQELISNSGSTFSNADYQINWSVGECVSETFQAGTFVLTQGFHQPLLTVTELNKTSKAINFKLYPNPTTNFINLQVSSNSDDELEFILTDISGKILQKKQFLTDNEQIDFSKLSNGTYLLAIVKNNELIKSFKIQKIN